MVDYTLLFGPLAEHSRVVYFAYHTGTRRMVYVSPAYRQVIGGAPERVNEELAEWKTRIHPDDLEYLTTRFTHVLTGELVQDVELRLRHADGRRQWLCLTATRVVGPDGALYISGTAHDITRQKAYMDNAEKYNAKKNAVLEILAHDLSGPLVLVQQLAEHVSEQSLQYQDASLDELVGLMRVTCKDSVDLIRDFVDQEFMESASVQLRRERRDMVTWARLVVEQYQSAADKLQKAFVFNPPPGPVYARVDLNKLEQVLNNLISNAIKFTPDGGRIEISVESAPGLVRVTVADNGIGIPEKLQPLLFDKFTRARRPGLRGEKTTGLGMSVIRTIVHLHDGTVRFTSQEGVGSRFVVEIPTALEDSEA